MYHLFKKANTWHCQKQEGTDRGTDNDQVVLMCWTAYAGCTEVHASPSSCTCQANSKQTNLQTQCRICVSIHQQYAWTVPWRNLQRHVLYAHARLNPPFSCPHLAAPAHVGNIAFSRRSPEFLCDRPTRRMAPQIVGLLIALVSDLTLFYVYLHKEKTGVSMNGFTHNDIFKPGLAVISIQ